MGVTGRPAAGARYVVERTGARPAEAEGSVLYRGLVHLPDADLPIEVTVELPGGATRARVVGAPDADADGTRARELEREAAALVRSATKSAVAAGRALPRKIARWRG